MGCKMAINYGGKWMRLIENIICIVILVFLPDLILSKLGFYDSMQTLISRRADNETD